MRASTTTKMIHKQIKTKRHKQSNRERSYSMSNFLNWKLVVNELNYEPDIENLVSFLLVANFTNHYCNNLITHRQLLEQLRKPTKQNGSDWIPLRNVEFQNLISHFFLVIQNKFSQILPLVDLWHWKEYLKICFHFNISLLQ